MTVSEKNEILSELSIILDSYIAQPHTGDKPVEMLTINECTELIKGLSKHTVRELVGRGELSSIRAGAGRNGKILVSKASLLAYIENAQKEVEV